MKHSESIANLSASLVKAQANIGGAVKNAVNPHFKSRFVDLSEIIAVCKAPLLDQGITVAQLACTLDNGSPGLETVLIHSSGEWMSSTMPVFCAKPNDPQALGSGYSYAKRYSLQSALLMASVDDDGEAAMFRQGDNQQDDRPSWEEPSPAKRQATAPWREVRIHFGKHLGKPLGSLESSSIKWFATDWAEKKKAGGPTSIEDEELLGALELWQKEQKS